MYLPTHFEEHRPGELQRVLREHPLGALITALGPILTGAIVGAITSGLLYMATSLWRNDEITWSGLGMAVLLGAG